MQGLSLAHAAAMGLSADTPFVVGASDGVLANLGAGPSSRGFIAVSIGTSGAVRSVVNKPLTDPEGTFVLLRAKGNSGRWWTDQ